MSKKNEMSDTELKNEVNDLYWKHYSYDEIAKKLKISWGKVISLLEVDLYG